MNSNSSPTSGQHVILNYKEILSSKVTVLGCGGLHKGCGLEGGKKKEEIKEKGEEWREAGVLDQISNVHGHFLNSSIVEGLNVSERALVIFGDHIDSDALSAKTAATSNTTQRTKVVVLFQPHKSVKLC